MLKKRASSSRLETSPLTGQRFARNLDWNLLRTFHEIVSAGGVSEAARQLNRGQPSISMALRRLEQHMGTTLCRRGPGGFSLTMDGELLSKKCETMFGVASGIPNTIANASVEIHGRLRVQMISNLVGHHIDVAIDQFHRSYPNVEIFLSIATWDVIQRSVMRNEVEIGIAPVTTRTAGLQFDMLFQETYRPYCGSSHPLFGQTVERPEELAEYAFLLTGADEPESQTRFRQRYGLGKHLAGLSEHLEEARRLAVLGVGLCFLPVAFAENDVIEGKLHPVLADGKDPVSDIFVISNPGAPPHHACQRMLGLLR
jgi:LysR family transcriptional regulator, transcriptional activator for bauABCD operon